MLSSIYTGDWWPWFCWRVARAAGNCSHSCPLLKQVGRRATATPVCCEVSECLALYVVSSCKPHQATGMRSNVLRCLCTSQTSPDVPLTAKPWVPHAASTECEYVIVTKPGATHVLASAGRVVIAILEQLRPAAVRIIVSSCEHSIAPLQRDYLDSRTGSWCIQCSKPARHCWCNQHC